MGVIKERRERYRCHILKMSDEGVTTMDELDWEDVEVSMQDNTPPPIEEPHTYPDASHGDAVGHVEMEEPAITREHTPMQLHPQSEKRRIVEVDRSSDLRIKMQLQTCQHRARIRRLTERLSKSMMATHTTDVMIQQQQTIAQQADALARSQQRIQAMEETLLQRDEQFRMQAEGYAAQMNAELQQAVAKAMAQQDEQVAMERRQIEKLRVEKENELAALEKTYSLKIRKAAASDGDSLPRASTSQVVHHEEHSEAEWESSMSTTVRQHLRELKRNPRKLLNTTLYASPNAEEDERDEECNLPLPSPPRERGQSKEDSEPEELARLRTLMMPMLIEATKYILQEEGNSRRPKASRVRRKTNVEIELQREKIEETADERSAFLAHVRSLFKDAYGISSDDDFLVHEPPSPRTVQAYSRSTGNGPTPEDLRLDTQGKLDSDWNQKLFHVLLQRLRQRRDEENWQLPQRSDAYFLDMIRDRAKRLRDVWRTSQPRATIDGHPETATQIEERMLLRTSTALKKARHRTRRHNFIDASSNGKKYERRASIIGSVLTAKKKEEADDVYIWEWLSSVLELLGEDGMSSEESGIEDIVNTVYRVKIMVWRRDIDRELQIIDRQRMIGTQAFSAQGSKPVPRIRSKTNPISDRAPVRGLPRAFYDDEWFQQQDEDYRSVTLTVSKEKFRWLDIAVRH
ncbi:hypothetical protein A0H81_10365 [Grifola frondosa]|uniref:Uncharacterized protein n=1 Tax=Grifola frondosa TaxID=5627 RepID=A0A1C7LZ04_GRIFR|nr:hypothetical protein A0H81_10365 [Grifola frondosa]